jgi:CheY-like chemotaxis protein
MNSKRRLIVEDDSDTRLTYHILLKVKHYETYIATDPLSCLWAHTNTART